MTDWQDEYRVLEVTESGKTWYEVQDVSTLGEMNLSFTVFKTRSKRKALKRAARENQKEQARANRKETWL